MNLPPSYPYEGILLVDKPTGWTSHDVVGVLRTKCKMKKIGHAGTLDPNATGLLIILLGKATRLSQYLTSKEKAYEGIFELGTTTDTYDVDGKVMHTHAGNFPEEEAVAETLKQFLGDQDQLPPMFSAKKVNGTPLYKYARKGKEIEREKVQIHVRSLELIKMEQKEVSFRTICSKGTYMRSLAHDIGNCLGCGAFLKTLRRTQSGDFKIEDALDGSTIKTLDTAIIKRRIIPIYKVAPPHILR